MYRIRASTEDGSQDAFVRTVFSRAELNSVASAVFAAVSQASKEGLNVSILDDPGQSLDEARTRALAHLLVELAKTRQLIVASEDRRFIRASYGHGRSQSDRIDRRSACG